MWDLNDTPESEAVQAEREIVEEIVRNDVTPTCDHFAEQQREIAKARLAVKPSITPANPDWDVCEGCGKTAMLYHNERTGLAFCEACDQATDQAVSFKRLRSGGWGLAGPSALLVADAEVVVTKKDGTTDVKRVGRVLWSGDGKAIATIRR
jgi:hypothetical protein